MMSCNAEEYCFEGEPVQMYEQNERTARKPHDCLLCMWKIEPGERYVYTSYLYEGKWDVEKMHKTCHQLRHLFNEAFGDPPYTAVGGRLPALLRCADACVRVDPMDAAGDQELAREFVVLARSHVLERAGAEAREGGAK